MKQWWLGLSLREKQAITAGGIAVLIFIVYAWIWMPLEDKIISMRTQIVQNQKLLAWMQAADKQLANATPTAPRSSASLLSIVQHQVKQSTLANQVYQLRQADNDAVQISFKQVDFDKLVIWLTEIYQQQSITITQFNVRALGTPGIVSAEIQLTS